MQKLTVPILPPGPTAKWWGLNHLAAMRSDYLGYVEELQRQHSDIAHLQVLNEHIFHVFNPDWVREILVTQSAALIRWERATEVFSHSMGQSVLVTEGAQWERQRRMLQPGFAPKRVAGYAKLMTDAARTAFSKLVQPKNDPKVDIEVLMTGITLDVIMGVLFGNQQVQDSRSVASAIQTLSQFAVSQLFKPFPWPMWTPVPAVSNARRSIKELNQLIDHHIHASPESDQASEKSLLTMLQLARDPNHPNEGLSDQELHDQIMVTFQAGHETSATALTWWCGLIAQHPDVAARIHDEVTTVLQGQDPTPETLAQMPWLQASIKEALRLYPPAALLFTRRACQNIKAGPWTIPKGSLIAFTPYVIQRDPRWFDALENFRPERFMDSSDIPRGAWMPFGVGPRVCIGQHFAILEIGLIAAMLMQRFRLAWPKDAAWPKTNLGVTLRPATPMALDITPR
jgi:cytochrome P450